MTLADDDGPYDMGYVRFVIAVDLIVVLLLATLTAFT